MSGLGPRLLDSRRHESDRVWNDYKISLDDEEAVRQSPFRHSLEALEEFGLTGIEISHPYKEDGDPTSMPEEDTYKWVVAGFRKFADTEKMVADGLGGDLTVCAEIGSDGSRSLEFSFGAGEHKCFDTEDLNETVWAHLEVIHKTLRAGWIGRRLPITSNLPEDQ